MTTLWRLISMTIELAIILACLICLKFAYTFEVFNISTTNLSISPSNINNPYNFDIPKAASTLLDKDNNNASSRLLSNINAIDLGLVDDYDIHLSHYCSSSWQRYSSECFYDTQYDDIRPIIENLFIAIGQDVALPSYVWSDISDLSLALIKADRCLRVSYFALKVHLCCTFILELCYARFRTLSCIFLYITFFIQFTGAMSLCWATFVATKIQFLTIILNTSYGIEVSYNIWFSKAVRISAAFAIGIACLRLFTIYLFFRCESNTQDRRSEKTVKLVPEKSHKL